MHFPSKEDAIIMANQYLGMAYHELIKLNVYRNMGDLNFLGIEELYHFMPSIDYEICVNAIFEAIKIINGIIDERAHKRTNTKTK